MPEALDKLFEDFKDSILDDPEIIKEIVEQHSYLLTDPQRTDLILTILGNTEPTVTEIDSASSIIESIPSN